MKNIFKIVAIVRAGTYIVLLLLAFFALFSCGRTREEMEGLAGLYRDTTIIDGCVYVRFVSENAYGNISSVVHKGNCPNKIHYK